jgi:hypothetical protein
MILALRLGVKGVTTDFPYNLTRRPTSTEPV